jgi:hypothetical protein
LSFVQPYVATGHAQRNEIHDQNQQAGKMP